jgi:hypothetical protein
MKRPPMRASTGHNAAAARAAATPASQHNELVDRKQVDDLAWDVVGRLRRHLSDSELNTVFVKLGVGESESAIETVLGRLAVKGAAIPEDLLTRLRQWVRGYQDNPAHPRLSKLLNYAERGPANP